MKTEAQKIADKKWRLKNKESERLRSKNYYIKNKDKKLLQGKNYSRTLEGFTNRLWISLNNRTINGSNPKWNNKSTKKYYLDKGIRLDITKEQLLQKITDNWNLIQDIRKTGQRPSLDRIDSNGHYELGNIRFITGNKNSSKNGDYIKFLAKNYNEFYIKTYNEFLKGNK
jgi:hypothetical protein